MPFSLEESLGFLNSLLDYGLEDEEQKDALEISHQLGGHPLAISHVTNLIYRTKISLKHYREIFEKGKAEQTLFQNFFTYEHPLESVCLLAFTNLNTQAKTLLDVIFFLDPDRISDSLLCQDLSLTVEFSFFQDQFGFINTQNNLLDITIHNYTVVLSQPKFI